jgi:hypothetical protein
MFRISKRSLSILLAATTALTATSAAPAEDWHNMGGNAGRNALSSEIGPDADDLLWSGGRTSIIAWHPVIEGRRAFMVRQSGWPSSEPGASPVVATDLDTGDELWAVDIPFDPDDWTTWVAGVRDGQVYAARSGNGASVSAPLYALDAANGDTLWISEDETTAGAYDGVVFAPNGDPIVASFRYIWRISALDGSTVWIAPRTGSVSGNCGAATHGDAVYVADAVYGGHEIVRYDLATGAEMYSSPIMTGFTIQNTPFVGPDGTVYLSRTQNNPSTDHFYAFEDTGTEFIEKWHLAAAWSTSSEFGVGPDGSVYMMIPGPELARLDPDTGTVLDTSGVLAGFSKPRMAIDARGRVYFSNGSFDTGRLYSFNADLTPRWDVPVRNINIGGPALGTDGTLVVCGVGTDVRAYRTEEPCPDLDGDGYVGLADLAQMLAHYGMTSGATFEDGDVDGDGDVDLADLATLLAAYDTWCD